MQKNDHCHVLEYQNLKIKQLERLKLEPAFLKGLIPELKLNTGSATKDLQLSIVS